MSRWRIAVVALLLAGPLLVLAGAGSYYLWLHGWSLIVWWPMMSLMFIGYGLALYWQSRKELLHQPEPPAEVYFTERDREAAKLVQARAEAGTRDHHDKLTKQEFYLEQAREMAVELAQFYHPGTADAIDNLTVPEMITAVELASEDLAEMVEKYLPGGHLLTVRDFKLAQQMSEWVETGSNIYWGVMALIDPIQTGLRYAASQVGINAPMRMLQQNLIGWFYTAFINRLGHYLIELNSGRLRVGAKRYRELRKQLQEAQAPVPSTNGQAVQSAPPPEDRVEKLTVTLLGQVKAGKSSLVNSILGEERARTASVPATEGLIRYELKSPDVPTTLVLIDTEGYGNEGPRQDQVAKTFAAAKQSELLLLVLHARNPGRKADLEMLQKLEAHFAANPDVKCPPIIAVMTHIDLLSPAMEWSPPYDWREGKRPKEMNIREAIEVIKQQLGEHLDAVVPACTASGKVYGVDEGVLPALAAQLNEARGVAFLKAVKSEADSGKIRKVFSQVWEVGKAGGSILWQAVRGLVAPRR
jgi:predicted GTPase